jgi:hypothetical protein
MALFVVGVVISEGVVVVEGAYGYINATDEWKEEADCKKLAIPCYAQETAM